MCSFIYMFCLRSALDYETHALSYRFVVCTSLSSLTPIRVVWRVLSFKFVDVDVLIVFVVKSSSFVQDVIGFVFEIRSFIPYMICISGI